jgi:4-hydroxybenzoate polyprenyltransferase
MEAGKVQTRLAAVPQPIATPLALPGLILKSMRPRQWTKNLLCAPALVMANRLRDGGSDLRMAACVGLFCMLSGAVYLLNDSLDVEQDRLHPIKRFRPVASGRLPVRAAQLSAVIIGLASLLASFILGFAFFQVAAAYMLLQLGYVFYFKHEVLLDVFAIALGYVLRAAAGAVAIHVEISVWLYLCTILGGLFLALGKRRGELIELDEIAKDHRRNLGEYSLALVDQLITIVSASTIVAYSLYTFTAPNLPTNHEMMITVPFAVYGIFRYLYLVHEHGQGGSPEEVLLRDRPLQVCIVLWGVIAIAVVAGSGHGT